MARFRAYVEAESGPPAQPSHLIIKAGGELTWGQEECLPRQIAKGNMMFRGERMVLRKRYDQSFFQDRLKREQVITGRQPQQTHMDLPLAQVLDEFGSFHLVELDFHTWKAVAKDFEEGGQQAVGCCAQKTDGQPPELPTARPPGHLDSVIQLGEGHSSFVKEGPAGFGKLDAPFGAV
jgi:hypothetical protein